VLRIYAANEDACLLGAEMCVPAAEHMAHLMALVIQRGQTAHDPLAMPFYHPVLEEGCVPPCVRSLSNQRVPDLTSVRMKNTRSRRWIENAGWWLFPRHRCCSSLSESSWNVLVTESFHTRHKR